MSGNLRVQQERLSMLMRGLGTRIVLYQQRVAANLDLPNNDFLSIDMLHERGPVTAGELSRLTGLSTGSVTALIDRLEKHGLVRREDDPNDRRKVIIVPLYENSDKVRTTYNSLNAKMLELTSLYSEDELETISRFLEQASLVIEGQIYDQNLAGPNKPSNS